MSHAANVAVGDGYTVGERLVKHTADVEVDQQPVHPFDFEDDEDRGAESTDRCYAYLLWRCLSEAPGNMLPLRGIYEWVLRNSQKARRDPGRGWQNSVRHNLSMNAVSLLPTPSTSLADFEDTD